MIELTAVVKVLRWLVPLVIVLFLLLAAYGYLTQRAEERDALRQLGLEQLAAAWRDLERDRATSLLSLPDLFVMGQTSQSVTCLGQTLPVVDLGPLLHPYLRQPPVDPLKLQAELSYYYFQRQDPGWQVGACLPERRDSITANAF